jgi:hydroxyacid-oxoacid transhydrogenase
MTDEIAFEMATSSLRFGAGVTREVGMDLADLGVRRALVVTDPNLTRLAPVQTVLAALDAAGVEAVLFDRARVEPTDESFREAIQFAERHPVDGIVAVGGGSVIDTAKAVNLYTTYPPADFLDYVNAPIGRALPVPGPLKPLIAIPTTAGTGSETTGVSIFDFTELHAKTGIASRRLKPTLGVLDPENTRTMPPQVAASSGLDILSHAIESFTAIPYTSRPRPASPLLRPAYQGSNPSATSGHFRHCVSSRSTWSAPSTIPATTRHARRWFWRRPMPVWDSATRVCTSRTACPTPYRGTSSISARPVIPRIIRSSRMGSR